MSAPDGSTYDVLAESEGESIDIDELPDGRKEQGKKFRKKKPSYLKYKPRETYHFTEYELTEYADAFALWNLTGDGLLVVDEVQRTMHMLGLEEPYEDFRRAVNRVDPEGKGVFDFQAFLDIMVGFRKHPITEIELMTTFSLIDADGGGSVDCAELKTFMCNVGNGLTADEADAMIASADNDDSGEIDYKEFAHAILSTQ